MCPLRSLVRGLLSGGLLDIDEPGWSLKGSCLTRAHHLPATLLLNKQRHVSPLFYNNAHMENANSWDVLVYCSAIVFVLGCLFPCLCQCFCVSLCVCVLYVFVCLSDWLVWAVQAMCAVPPCHLVDRPPWCIGLIPPMQVLNRWSTQGATNFDAETRTSHDIAGGTQKVSQTPPSRGRKDKGWKKAMIAIVAIRPIYHLDFMITTYLSPDAALRRIPELLVTKVVWDSTPLILIRPSTLFFLRVFFATHY